MARVICGIIGSAAAAPFKMCVPYMETSSPESLSSLNPPRKLFSVSCLSILVKAVRPYPTNQFKKEGAEKGLLPAGRSCMRTLQYWFPTI